MGEKLLLRIRQYHEELTKIIDFYVIPLASIFIVITNSLVIIVYWKEFSLTKNKIRKVASLLYVFIGLANILAVVPKSGLYLYAFLYLKIEEYIPYQFCGTWFYINEFTTIPHCASILFVTTLSIQRYQIIKQPFYAGQKWTIRKTFLKIFTAILLSVLFPFLSFIGSSMEPYDVRIHNETGSNITFTTCHVRFADWVDGHGVDVAIGILIAKFFIILLPSASIILYCDLSLIIYLRMITRVHSVLTHASSALILTVVKRDCKHVLHGSPSQEGNPHIVIILILSSVVLIVEIPYTILIIIHIYFLTLPSPEQISGLRLGPIRNIIDLTVVLSYPTLFISSCLTSKRFRTLMQHLCVCPCKRCRLN